MSKINLVQPEKISLKDHPILTESWLQDKIAENPEIIGLGDLILKDKERKQLRVGRLDILLQDPEINKRYEVEIQLGKTDESHIIRTIEYWDIERKRYPQYEHVAVLVAEDVTSRFLNVISLFNGVIPIIAIQAHAIKVGDKYTLVFSRVLDQMKLGLVDDDEVIIITDRNYWEKRATKSTLKITDDIFEMIKELDLDLQLNYNKYYIGLSKDGITNNFVIFKPKKQFVHIELKIDKDSLIEEILEESGLDYSFTRWGRYKITLNKGDLQKHKELIYDLIKKSYGA